MEKWESCNWIVIKIHRTIKNALGEPRVVRAPLPTFSVCKMQPGGRFGQSLAEFQHGRLYGLFRRVHSCGLVTRSATYDDRWNVR